MADGDRHHRACLNAREGSRPTLYAWQTTFVPPTQASKLLRCIRLSHSTGGTLQRSWVFQVRLHSPVVSTRRCTGVFVDDASVLRLGDAASTNERFKFLLARPDRSECAFDLPTQMGYDSDHSRAEGEVGKVGVAIDSLDDMRTLLADIPLDKVSTSMTINSTAAILLLMYQIVAEEQGVSSEQISGTIQNDLLKEYIARGTYVYPPKPSMRIITDIFGYCSEHIPKWNTISISGYHIREAGSTAVQEIAFTLANAIAYVQTAVDAGLDVDDFAPLVVLLEWP